MNNNFLPYQLKKSSQQNTTMANEIGILSNLKTNAKTDLVSAVNENNTSLAQNTSQLLDKLTKINPLRAPFNVVGNANYYKTSNSTWYQDSAYTIPATDDTNAIKSFISYMQTNYPYEQIIFPQRKYLITSTITIPQQCQNIDFGYSTFQYMGASGTACLSGGASSDLSSGGYVFADWKNLTVQCDPNQTKICNGLDIQRLRTSNFTNISVLYANYGFVMGDSWSTCLYRCKPWYCNIGIVTGRSSNAVNISKCEIDNCNIGVEIGNGRTNGFAFGVNGCTLDNQTLIQNCSIGVQLYYIKQATVTNCYFESNTVTVDVPLISGGTNGIDEFVFTNNIVDFGASGMDSFLKLWDTSRPVSFIVDNNEFTGVPNNTVFNRDTGVVGNITNMSLMNNNFASITDFTKVFPDNWKLGRVRTDFGFVPTIDNTQWTVIQTVKIHCLGNNQFEITGTIQRKTGTTSTLLTSHVPYYMGNDSYIVGSSPIFQSATGSGGSLTKLCKLEIPTWPKQVNIYTPDTTDLNNIVLNAKWCTR